MIHIIRKSNSKDISRIAEILIFGKRTAYREIFKNDKVSFGEMQVLPLALQFMDSPNLLHDLVVYDDEFVKGMANVKLSILYDGVASLEIVEFYVDPFFQGKGIGSEMILHIQNVCKGKGVKEMFLWVLEKNKAAQRFYKINGFHLTDERKLEEGTPEYVLKYVKKL